MRLLPPLLMIACAVDPPGLVGRVVRDGRAVAAVTVQVDGSTTRTDDEGRFAVSDAPPHALASVALGDDRVVTGWRCGDDVTLDLTVPEPATTGVLTVTLRNVRLGGDSSRWGVDVVLLDGDERSPVAVRPALDLAPLVVDPDDSTVWRATWEVPVSRRLALGVSHLISRPYNGEPRWVVDTVVVLEADGLQPGEARPVEVLMSPETLRDRWLWDGTGPGGAKRALIEQEVTIDDLTVRLPVWDGPTGFPGYVSGIKLRPSAPTGAYRGVFRFGRYEGCAGRELVAPMPLGPAEIPRWWIGTRSDTGTVEVDRIGMEEPYPAPVHLRRTLPDRMALSVLEPGRGWLDGTLVDGTGRRWELSGSLRCAPRVLAWPWGDVQGALEGELRWVDGARSGSCTVRDGG